MLNEPSDTSPEIPVIRNPEIPKSIFSRPLTFVLDVIFVDLDPLYEERSEFGS